MVLQGGQVSDMQCTTKYSYNLRNGQLAPQVYCKSSKFLRLCKYHIGWHVDPHIYLASGWRLFTFLVIKSNNLKFMEVLSRKIENNTVFAVNNFNSFSKLPLISLCKREGFFKIRNVYRVFSKGRNGVGAFKSLIFRTFPDVLGFLLPFNMGDYSFWYFWDI